MKTDEITWKLENEKIGRLLVGYAVPAVVGTMVNSLYNIVDRIFIGQGVGPLAISGLALTFPILIFLQAFGMLIGAGSATRVSIFLGQKEKKMAEKVLGNAFSLTLIISVLTIVPSMLFMEELLLAFGGSEQTISYAMDYLYIVIPANLLASFSFGFNAIMRASGYPRKAMLTMIIGAVLNLVLDPIFIFWLDMGIRGAAVATAISMLVTTVFVFHHFMSKESLIRFYLPYLRLNKKVVWSILSIGISPFLIQLTGSLVTVIMNKALKENGGDLAIGANGIISSVGMLLIMFVLGVAQGMQPIVGYNHGAGQHKRVMETLRLVIIVATCIMGTGWICCLLFPGAIAGVFTNDPELLAISTNGLFISCFVLIVIGSQIVITQFFQSIGVVWKSIFLSLSRQIIYLTPAIMIFPVYFGLDGVWMAYPFSDSLAALTSWLLLALYIRKIKKEF